MLGKKTRTRLRRIGTVAIIDLIGDVTEHDQETVKSAYAEVLKDAPERILLNFSEVEYINTSGIAVLIAMVMEAEKTGRKIGFYGMSPHYRKVFTLVRLPLYAELYQDEAEALGSQ